MYNINWNNGGLKLKAKISWFEDEDSSKEPILHIEPENMNEASSLGILLCKVGGGFKKSMTNSKAPEYECNIIDLIERIIE